MVRLNRLCQVVLIALIVLTVSMTNGARLHRRSAEIVSTTPTAKTECRDNTPCGWAVYTPFTRKVDYFMQNTCECPTTGNLVCVRTDDDLSVSAYVYRCREVKSSNDTDSS